jgi:hypothetical protein
MPARPPIQPNSGAADRARRRTAVADILDEAKAAFQAAWEVCYRREKPT